MTLKAKLNRVKALFEAGVIDRAEFETAQKRLGA